MPIRFSTSRIHRLKALLNSVAVLGALCSTAEAQLLTQSRLTEADTDPSFKLTADLMAQDPRWLGVSPRDVVWSPDCQRRLKMS
jgi:hypothetical protein